MPRHKATFIHTKAVTGSPCCLLPRNKDVSEELSEEESRIARRAQRTALEDTLKKNQILIKNLKDTLRQAAFQKNPHKARSYAYEKIKVILEEQE